MPPKPLELDSVRSAWTPIDEAELSQERKLALAVPE